MSLSSQLLMAGRPHASSVVTPALPSSRAHRARRLAAPRWFIILALLALAGYGVFLGTHMTVVAGGSDSSGYLNSARLLAAGKLQTDLRVPPEIGTQGTVDRYHFSPQGFGLFPSNPRLPPSYPTGLPLHLALAGLLFGWNVGPFLVQLGAALAAVWLCYCVARELGVRPMMAAAGAVTLATFPVMIFTSIQTLSDTLATTWTLAAVFCGLRGRRSTAWAAACGAALAIAVLVRPTNLLIAPGLLVLLGWDRFRIAAFVAGGLPGAAWLAYYNHQLYGGAFRSGYGPIHSSFALHYGWMTAVHFAKWLALLLPAVLLVLPVAAFIGQRARRRELLGLALAVGGIVGVYLFYDVSHDVWWCLRFIVPAAALLIVIGLVGFEAIVRRCRLPRRGGIRVACAAILMAWATVNSWYWTKKLAILYVPGYERAYAEAAQLLRSHAPQNALILCSAFSGTVYYYTDLPTLVYDSIEPDQFARYAAAARGAGRPIYAAIFDIEEADSIYKRCPGAWKRVGAAGNIGIWHLQ